MFGIKAEQMNTILKLLINIVLIIGWSNQIYGQVNKIMTINIRYDTPRDSIDRWDNRKSELVEMVRYYEPEIFGIQEGLLNQVLYLEENLGTYARIGVGRDDGKDKGEFSAIFYNKEKLSLHKESTFWLSETSEKISIGWDASMERVCTYGLFERKEDRKKIWIFNTHYDHIGKVARRESSKLILQKINEINTNNIPVVLMGDFNAEPDDEPIQLLTKDLDDASKLAKNGIYGPKGTYTGFHKNVIAKRRIDYIFTKNLRVKKYRHIDDKMKNNNYISDHLPVLIEMH